MAKKKTAFCTLNLSPKQEPKAAIDIIAYIYRIAHTESERRPNPNIN